MQLKCFVLEDQAPARQLIESYISKRKDLEFVGSAALPDIAAKVLASNSIDLLFLDLQLPQEDGFNFLKSLNHKPTVIVTTAFPKRAVEGFEAGVADYLVKPFSYDRFSLAVDRAKLLHSPTTEEIKVEIPTGRGKYLYIDSGEIIWLSADGDYVLIHTLRGKFHVQGPLSKWVKKLPKEIFVQIHRSYIININSVTAKKPHSITVGDSELPIGNKYLSSLNDIVLKKRDNY
jgi:DNA-binding LytR/AlgR family response regulator